MIYIHMYRARAKVERQREREPSVLWFERLLISGGSAQPTGGGTGPFSIGGVSCLLNSVIEREFKLAELICPRFCGQLLRGTL